MMAIITTDTVKFRDVNVRRSSKARSCRWRTSWRATKVTRPSVPIASGAHAREALRLGGRADQTQAIHAAAEADARQKHGADIERRLARLLTFSMRRAPSSNVAMAMGSTSANSHRHAKTLRMSPEIVGPTAGATEITIEMLPIVLPRDRGGHEGHHGRHQQRQHDRRAGRRITRAITSTVRPGATAATSVPTKTGSLPR